jgi:hypothetical protein
MSLSSVDVIEPPYAANQREFKRAHDRASHARSRITNGALFSRGLDMRSTWARRARDLIAAHVGDLGGVEACSEAERSLVRRISVITVELERLELKLAQSKEPSVPDLMAYQTGANCLRRLLESIGLRRRARDISPMQFMRQIESEQSPADAAADAHAHEGSTADSGEVVDVAVTTDGGGGTPFSFDGTR